MPHACCHVVGMVFFGFEANGVCCSFKEEVHFSSIPHSELIICSMSTSLSAREQ